MTPRIKRDLPDMIPPPVWKLAVDRTSHLRHVAAVGDQSLAWLLAQAYINGVADCVDVTKPYTDTSAQTPAVIA